MQYAATVAALEDKIVQYAVGKVLEQIYEADFLGFSYGFRPGRSQHDALDALYIGITERKVNWVLRKFGLELHPEKTRLIEFGRFAAMNRQRRKQGRPETFDFLGFTHYCGTTRGGAFALKRKSIAKRMAAKLQKVKKELREQMHATIREQGRWLGSVVRGWFQYHAVPSNRSRLDRFRKEVLRLWLRTLRRRSQKARQKRTWDRVARKGRLWLPPPRILHPYPSERFYVTHPR